MMVNKVKVFIRRFFEIYMIHLNRESDSIGDVQPEVNFLFRFGLPEMYQAADLGDFYFHRHEIIPTRRFGLTGLFYNGTAFVSIAPGAFYTPLSCAEGQLRDVTCFFNAGFTRRARAFHPPIVEPFKMYDLLLQYTVKTDQIAIHSFRDHGPQGPQQVSRLIWGRFVDGLRLKPSIS